MLSVLAILIALTIFQAPDNTALTQANQLVSEHEESAPYWHQAKILSPEALAWLQDPSSACGYFNTKVEGIRDGQPDTIEMQIFKECSDKSVYLLGLTPEKSEQGNSPKADNESRKFKTGFFVTAKMLAWECPDLSNCILTRLKVCPLLRISDVIGQELVFM